MPKYKPTTKKCVICGRTFECYNSNKFKNGMRSKGFRPFHSITCSKACARERNVLAQDKYRKNVSK